MGIGDFFVNIKGKNEQLNNVKHGVRKDQVDKKYHNLFDAYDTNQDGTLEANELEGIFKGLQNFAGSDRVLDSSENAQVKSIFAEQANIQDADFQGFVKSVSDASAEIVSTTETKTSDGGKEITTTYSDGTIETIGYYPDGDYKFRRTEAHQETTQTNYTINGNTNKLYSVAELKQKINSAYKQHKKDIEAKNKQSAKLDSARTYFVWPFDTFAQNYISKNNILPFTTINKTDKLDIELSERGKKDAAVREFVLTHYIETHKAAKEALDSMGLLDDTGALINAGAGIAWNKIKNVWNGTEEEYQDFYSLKDKFEPNYDKALKMEGTLKVVQNNPEGYFRGEVGNIDTEKGAKFQEKTEQYQNARILNTRINLLKEAISEIRMFQSEQGIQSFTPTQGEGLNPSSHILNAKNLLLQCVGGDQEAVDMLLDGTVGNAYATLKRIQEILNDTEKLNKTILNGQSFDEIQNEYKSQYKEMYGTDFVPDELTEKVMDAKATGGMVKLAAITIVSIIVTRSPIMAQINGAIVGSAEATGAVANLMRTLVTKYGQTAVAQGIRFAMTSGTLATDVGLTLLNQVTSERGVDGEELWESTKSSAKYIYFGSYIGGPLAQVVSKQLGKIGVASKMFEGGAKVTTGGVQTTTITGDKLVQNLMKGGNKVLTKGGAFLTDVAAFTGLEVVTEGQDIATAGKEQLEFLPKLKIMNHLIECMLGGKVHAGMHKVKMDAAIEQSGVKNWEIKEIKTPSKTMYEVKVQDGLPLVRFEDKNKLITAMLEVVASKYEKLIDAKGAQKVSDKENVKIDADGEITANGTEVNNVSNKLKKETETKTDGKIENAVPLMGKSEVKLQKLADKKFDETTIPQTKTILKELGFTDDEIASIDLKNSDVQRLLEACNNILKYSPNLRENFDNADILEWCNDVDALKELIEVDARFCTNENMEYLSKYLEFDKDGKWLKGFDETYKPETCMSLLPILTENGKYKVSGEELYNLGYSIDSKADLAKITPENVAVLRRINEGIKNKKYAVELKDMLKFDETKPLTAEFMESYIKEVNRFAKYELSGFWGGTLAERMQKYKTVADFLEKYPIDLTVKGYDNDYNYCYVKLSGASVLDLAKAPDKAAVQKFVNSLSNDARHDCLAGLELVNKGFPAEKLADLLNIVSKKEFGEVQDGIIKLIDEMLEGGSKDYDGMVKLIKAYQGTRCLSHYSNAGYVKVANGDYSGAAKYVEIAKELKMDPDRFSRLIQDKNADFKTVVECLSYIKDNNIDLSSYNEYTLFRDKNCKENVAKIEYLKQQGFDDRAGNLYMSLVGDWKSGITFEEFKAKYEFIRDNDYIKSQDVKGFMQEPASEYLRTRIANSDLSLQEIKELTELAQRNSMSLNDTMGVLDHSQKLNYKLAKSIFADGTFPLDQIPKILNAANDNIKLSLAEKLCSDKEFSPAYIARSLKAYNGCYDVFISVAKSGLLQKYPNLLEYNTSDWETIIKRNLIEHPEFNYNKNLILTLADAKNGNIVELHNTLIKDAQANKDLLKSGLEDITDADINKVMNSKEAVKTIDIIGLGNAEAAFPLMLEEFEYFTRDVVQLSDKLSVENRELLAQKLTPECSEKYSTLNQEIINLKKQLNDVVGTENLAKIKGLQAQKTKIDEQMKSLKQSDNANTPEVKQQLKEMQKQSKALGAQAQSIYYQGENANQVKEIMKQISTKSKELKTFVQEKTGLEPQDVVTKVRVLSAMQEISTPEEMAEFINMIKPSTPENDAVWNDAVNKKIFQKLGVEFDEQLSQKLDLIHCKYLSKMFVSSKDFFNNMKTLVETIKENPNLTIEQALDRMPQNIETKNMYQELGIDYDKWTKVDKNSYTSVEIKLNAEEAKQAAIHNLEEDLNDALFKALPKEVTEPIFEQLKEKLGVTFEKSQKDNWVGDGFSAGTTEYYRLMKDGKPITFEDMDDIVSTIKKEILNNDFWTTTNADVQLENARGTLYTHLIKMRTQEVDNAMSLKDGETSEIEIRKTDMYDVKKALGLGNDAQCCTALGRQFNEWSAPTYIMNKCIGAIELTDKGAFAGNTMIYIAYVDGKPALVLDNIELKTKYHNNDKIRDTFVNYAKKLCEELGQPDLPIYAGPNRHKLNMDIFPKEERSMLPIGSTGKQKVYLDYDAGSHIIGTSEQPVSIQMYKIR